MTSETRAEARSAAWGARDDLATFLDAPPVRPWYRRPWIVGSLVAGVVVLLLIVRSMSGASGPAYATEPARRDTLTVTVSATGNLQPTNEVEVGSEQSGLVEAVFVDNNDRVTRGQPLARLDPSRLRDTLAQAQASLASAQATVAQNRASASQAAANLARQQQVYRLSGGKVPSETELDTARAEAARTQAGIRAAEAQVAQARASVSSAQTNLSKATIYSPVNGVVLSRSVDPGQTVAASLSAPVLFTLAEDLSQMELEVKVDEADVGEVKAGQKATFTVDAFPGRRFEALLKRVDLGANASDGGSTTAAAGASSGVIAYTAVLGVANADLLLRPGMTATASIVTSERRNVLLVPNGALRFKPADTAGASSGKGSLLPVPGGTSQTPRSASIGRGSVQTIYVLGEDGRPQARQVTVGNNDGARAEITSGRLRPGEKVITGQLAEGSGGTPEEAAMLPLLAVLPGRRRRG